MDRLLKLKQFYNNVLAQTTSSSGRYLFAGNLFGDIFVQDLRELEKTNEPYSSLKIFPQGEQVEINCLSFHRDFLIVGAIGVIYGLEWNEDSCTLSSQRKWEILIPLEVDALDVPDVNSIWLRSNTDMLFAACGDNIYQIDLEDGRIVRNYCGHTDYLHVVTGEGANRLYSASEDGTVRFWCEKEKLSTGKIEPWQNANLDRPEFGRWVGAVAANKTWLICGGGPKFAVWHLASMQSTNDFAFPGKIHVCDFVEDNVFVGGEHNTVQSYALNGDLVADIPVENSATYSIVWKTYPVRFMSIAGYSNKLHILNDFRFLDSKINLYDDKNFPTCKKKLTSL